MVFAAPQLGGDGTHADPASLPPGLPGSDKSSWSPEPLVGGDGTRPDPASLPPV